jgi:hypothetical protein
VGGARGDRRKYGRLDRRRASILHASERRPRGDGLLRTRGRRAMRGRRRAPEARRTTSTARRAPPRVAAPDEGEGDNPGWDLRDDFKPSSR